MPFATAPYPSHYVTAVRLTRAAQVGKVDAVGFNRVEDRLIVGNLGGTCRVVVGWHVWGDGTAEDERNGRGVNASGK